MEHAGATPANPLPKIDSFGRMSYVLVCVKPKGVFDIFSSHGFGLYKA